MLVVFGNRLVGRTDGVRDTFFVATEFFSVMLVPLVPIRTWLVLEPMQRNGLDQQRWNGRRVSMSLKSVLLGWARGFLCYNLVLSLTVLLALAPGAAERSDVLFQALFALASLVAFLVVQVGFRNASFERALDLLRRCELPDSIAQRVQTLFRRPVVGDWPGRFADPATGSPSGRVASRQ